MDASSLLGEGQSEHGHAWARTALEDAIIRGVLFVPIFTKFLTQMHRDALSPNPALCLQLGPTGHGHLQACRCVARVVVMALGRDHSILWLQADGHAGLHRIPDVHPALS